MFAANIYGDTLADIYEEIYPPGPDGDQAAEFISKNAPKGSVLELGVGTGRLALPMARKGLSVHGVDASSRMLEKLKENDTEKNVRVTEGDFSEELPNGLFDVSLIGLNTLFMVPDPEKQIDTLRLMRSRTKADGIVVVETYDPRIYHGRTEPKVDAHHLANGQISIHTTYVNSLEQTIVVAQTFIGEGTLNRLVEISRYAWLPELDLMARVSGLRLRSRFSSWNEEPVTDASRRYISVYEVSTAQD